MDCKLVRVTSRVRASPGRASTRRVRMVSTLSMAWGPSTAVEGVWDKSTEMSPLLGPRSGRGLWGGVGGTPLRAFQRQDHARRRGA
eukprot:201055-Prymnesium_polylepis.1